MNGNSKITPDQRDELIRVYFEHGREAAGDLAEQYGVSRKYPSSVAAVLGMGRRDIHQPRSVNDPRWARARAVGEVVA